MQRRGQSPVGNRLSIRTGARITIWRWRGWVLKARGDAALAKNDTHVSISGSVAAGDSSSGIPGDERQQRQARRGECSPRLAFHRYG